MIKQIEIENFQGYSEPTVINLCKGINVFTGSSRAGKSTISRALDFCINNQKPKGEFISWGKKSCSVSLLLSSGIKVSRIISNSKKSPVKNGYVVTFQNDHEKTFEASGRSVPQEVQEIFNIADESFQSQHAKPFLISETSGEVARHINSVANMDSIDLFISKINSDLRDENTKLSLTQEQIEKVKEELKSFSNLSKLKSIYKTAKQKEEEKTNAETQCKQLEILIKKASESNERLEKMPDFEMLSAMDRKSVIVEQSILEIVNQKKELRRIGQRFSHLSKACENASYSVAELGPLLVSAESLQSDVAHLQRLIAAHKTNIEEQKQIEKEIADIQSEIDALPDVCPMCNGTGKIK